MQFLKEVSLRQFFPDVPAQNRNIIYVKSLKQKVLFYTENTQKAC